jgi:hypothetical protein
MEITRQADYYGLPDNSPPPTPPAEHVADVLAKPVPWSGPVKVAGEHDAPAPLQSQMMHSEDDGRSRPTGELGRGTHYYREPEDRYPNPSNGWSGPSDPPREREYTYMEKGWGKPDEPKHRAGQGELDLGL